MLLHAARPPSPSRRTISTVSTQTSRRPQSIASYISAESSSSHSQSTKHRTRVRTTGRGGSGNIKRKQPFEDKSVGPEPGSPPAGREVFTTHAGNSISPTAGRGGAGNITHTKNIAPQLSTRSADLVAQHSARTAEYEHELIKQSAEARRRHTTTSGRGGAGNNYLRASKGTTSKAPKRIRARAATILAIPASHGLEIPPSDLYGRQRTASEPSRSWLLRKLGRRLRDRGKQNSTESADIDEYEDDEELESSSMYEMPRPRSHRRVVSVAIQTSEDPTRGDSPTTQGAYTFGVPGAPGHSVHSRVPWSDTRSIASSSWSFHNPRLGAATRSYESFDAASAHTFGAQSQSDRGSGLASSFYRLCTASDPMFGRRRSVRSVSTGNTDHIGALMLDSASDTDGGDADDDASDYEAGVSLYAEVAGTEFTSPRTTPRLTVQAPSPRSSSHRLSTYSSDGLDERVDPSIYSR